MSDDDLLLPDSSLPFGSGVIGVCDICGKRQAVIILQKERYKLCVLDFLNKTWVGSKVVPGRPLPPYRSERIWFETDASPAGRATAILLTPTKATKHPGILLTPDIFGLTTMLLDAGVRFAREGFEVLLPDLTRIDGISATEFVSLRADVLFRGGVRVESPGVRKLVGLYLDALKFLRSRPMVDPAKTGIFGASYGGSLALAVAGEDQSLSAVGVAFPMPLQPAGFLRLVSAPTLLVSGESDPQAARSRRQFGEAKAPQGPALTVQSYPGVGHMFLARDSTTYDVSSAEAAWQRFIEFFRAQFLPPAPKPPAPPVARPAPPPTAPLPPSATPPVASSAPSVPSPAPS